MFRASEPNLRPAEPSSRHSLIAWGVLMAFLMAQVGDGLLTYAGITQFGWQIEANPIIKWYVMAFGPETGLAGAKTFAFACVLPLHCRGMYRTIGALTLYYVAGAVIPWLHVLSN